MVKHLIVVLQTARVQVLLERTSILLIGLVESPYSTLVPVVHFSQAPVVRPVKVSTGPVVLHRHKVRVKGTLL
jgi:hypothetical protein